MVMSSDPSMVWLETLPEPSLPPQAMRTDPAAITGAHAWLCQQVVVNHCHRLCSFSLTVATFAFCGRAKIIVIAHLLCSGQLNQKSDSIKLCLASDMHHIEAKKGKYPFKQLALHNITCYFNNLLLKYIAVEKYVLPQLFSLFCSLFFPLKCFRLSNKF